MKNGHALLLLGAIGVALAGMYLLARQEGYLVVHMPGVEIQLKGRLGGGLTLQSGSPPVAVPARVYVPVSLTLTSEQDGHTWKLLSRGPWGELARIRIERRRTTAIELGPPLRMESRVYVRSGQVDVDLAILGRAGEKYARFLGEGDHRIREPQMSIIDEAGTVLASGPFKYG